MVSINSAALMPGRPYQHQQSPYLLPGNSAVHPSIPFNRTVMISKSRNQEIKKSRNQPSLPTNLLPAVLLFTTCSYN